MNYLCFSSRAYFIFNFQIFMVLYFRVSSTSEKTQCTQIQDAQIFALERCRCLAFALQIYQTLLTMYWHCDVIDLPIYLGTKKWLNVVSSQRNERNIPSSMANERFYYTTMQRPHGIWRNLRRGQSFNIQFIFCSSLVQLIQNKRSGWFQSSMFFG